MDIVTRREWGARAPDPRPFPQTSWANRTGFVVHYSAADDDQTVRSIQNYQMDSNGWRDIGYNFLVDKDGKVYEGAQGTWFAIGAHVANHNTANIGVCAIGKDSQITDNHKRAIRWLYDEACRRAGKTLAKRYHSGMAGASTSCPGDNLRAWVQKGMPKTWETQEVNDVGTLEGKQADQLRDTHFTLTSAINSPTGTGSVPHHVWAEWLTGVVKLIASKVDIDASELEAIEEAAKRGAAEAIAETHPPAGQTE